jgi:hypothetical protein
MSGLDRNKGPFLESSIEPARKGGGAQAQVPPRPDLEHVLLLTGHSTSRRRRAALSNTAHGTRSNGNDHERLSLGARSAE